MRQALRTLPAAASCRACGLCPLAVGGEFCCAMDCAGSRAPLTCRRLRGSCTQSFHGTRWGIDGGSREDAAGRGPQGLVASAAHRVHRTPRHAASSRSNGGVLSSSYATNPCTAAWRSQVPHIHSGPATMRSPLHTLPSRRTGRRCAVRAWADRLPACGSVLDRVGTGTLCLSSSRSAGLTLHGSTHHPRLSQRTARVSRVVPAIAALLGRHAFERTLWPYAWGLMFLLTRRKSASLHGRRARSHRRRFVFTAHGSSVKGRTC